MEVLLPRQHGIQDKDQLSPLGPSRHVGMSHDGLAVEYELRE